jgi:putative ATP-dependent endonuclease of OLD family
MKLTEVKIRNFRCYKEETRINLGNLTALIGKNDGGKSSVLEALEIFFNNDVVKIDSDDLNKEALAAEDLKVDITCVFEDLPNEIILDASFHTTLESEHLLNRNGKLEIKKCYACGLKAPKENVFIKAYYPSAIDAADLHQLKKSELKGRATSLGVASSQYNGNINSSIRLAIWNHISDLQKADQEIPIDKEDAKKIWDVLKTFMPVYALFQSDRESRENDKEVTDPMKVAIKEALREVNYDMGLNNITESINAKIGARNYELIYNAMTDEVSSSLGLAKELKLKGSFFAGAEVKFSLEVVPVANNDMNAFMSAGRK